MIYKIFSPAIFALDPEKAHQLAISFLKYFPNLATIFSSREDFSNLQQNIFGLNFSSPIGMAAGFDKNAEIIKALQQFGFGFVEAGTVTPKAQSGNPLPRIFRLSEDKAIVNCLGFNNKGCEIFSQNISSVKSGILGINIGKNKDSESAIDDYLFLLDKFYEKASYITLNISSPNTKNLRDLQGRDQLNLFLTAIISKKNQLQNQYKKATPIFLKLAPDLSPQQQEEISELALVNKIDALIISNTTIARPSNLKSKNVPNAGGLSGKPLFLQSNEVLKNFYKFTKGKIHLVGVGGISSAEDAYCKIKLGASLVQIYTSFVYQGFGAVEKMKKELSKMVKDDGFNNISQAIGVNVK